MADTQRIELAVAPSTTAVDRFADGPPPPEVHTNVRKIYTVSKVKTGHVENKWGRNPRPGPLNCY